jgi:hypothetical protein
VHTDLSVRAALVDFVVRWGLGWRYLVSRRFRRTVHERWASRSGGERAIDVAAFIIAFVTLNGFIVLACMWIYDGIVSARLQPPGV